MVSDGDGIAVVGNPQDVDRFLLESGLDKSPSRELDVQRLRSFAATGGAAVQVGADIAANSGRWVKLTTDSARAVNKFGLMPTKTPGVSHAMIGKPGDIQQWIQIARTPTVLLQGPFAFAAISTMMQQQAMQQQMDAIVEYLQEINEKVDDILRNQKDAVLADLIGVDLIIEDALLVRDQVGRVSDVTWSKVQGASMSLARTQGYAVRQLDGIAEKLAKHADLGDVAKATREAEPQVREWLAVLARTFQLLDGAAVIELDRVLDAAPEELDNHRLGLIAVRENRLEVIGRSTERLLLQMDETVKRANSKVLFNPFNSPAAVKSSNSVASGVLEFRGKLGIESGHEASDARRWGQAAGEVRDRMLASAADARERASDVFRAVDTDGDGVPDKRRITAAADEAGAAIADAASGVAGAFGSLFKRRETAGPNAAAEDAAPQQDATDS
ncbi:hypothetical protein ACQCX5_05435 [Propionibacteriaceae bacterium G57]|uniref:hypothetical protein n=1 Tax=Aestuariimicrobium sp. G57 TaxID=3418485 RepID=UPI003DA6ED82